MVPRRYHRLRLSSKLNCFHHTQLWHATPKLAAATPDDVRASQKCAHARQGHAGSRWWSLGLRRRRGCRGFRYGTRGGARRRGRRRQPYSRAPALSSQEQTSATGSAAWPCADLHSRLLAVSRAGARQRRSGRRVFRALGLEFRIGLVELVRLGDIGALQLVLLERGLRHLVGDALFVERIDLRGERQTQRI